MQLAFSPDGKALAAQTAEGKIHVFDLGTRKALREIGERAPKSFPLAIRDIFALAWSPDSTLIAQAWGPGRIRIWNAESGRETTPVPNGHVGPVDQVFALASDENLMSVGSDRTVRTWNLRTKTQSRLVDLPSETRLARLVNPHRCFVTFDTWRDVDPAVAIWDVATWKEVATVKGPRPGNPGIFRSGDGSSVVIGNVFFGHGSGGEALILDSKSGDRLEGSQKYRHGEDQSLALLSKSPARGLVAYVIVKEKFIGFGLGPSLFPHIQCARNDGPVVWEIGSKTNDEWFSAHISAIEFSPDDRILVVKQWEGLTLYDSFTGRVRFEFSMPRNCFQIEHGFSKSGDLLAIASNDGTILVFDVRRGRQIERLVGGQGPVTSLEFVDSTTLFSGGADGTILVWDLRQARRDAKADRPTTDCDFRASWKALAEPDPKTANVAASKLIDSATETVLRLSGLVTQVKPLDQVQLAKDLTRLDDSKFEVRDQADAALRRAGALALPMLIEALKAPKSLEQKRRLTSLIELAKARSQIPDAEEMRQHRAIEILEAVGSDEAKAILSILADGAPESRITNDAIWALKRCKNAK